MTADPFCYEAYDALITHHLLSNEQELELLEALPIPQEDRWLSLLYLTMCKKVLVPTAPVSCAEASLRPQHWCRAHLHLSCS